jgi:hypothetical protein
LIRIRLGWLETPVLRCSSCRSSSFVLVVRVQYLRGERNGPSAAFIRCSTCRSHAQAAP